MMELYQMPTRLRMFYYNKLADAKKKENDQIEKSKGKDTFLKALFINVQDDLKEKLSYNTIEYFKKIITCLETSNYSNIYLANKLIKCISIFLNCKQLENKSNEYNLAIYSCLNSKNSFSKYFI